MLGVGFNVVNLKIREYGPANFELASGSGSAPRPAGSSSSSQPGQSRPSMMPSSKGEATRIAQSVSLSMSDSGGMVAADWAAALDMLQKYTDLKTDMKAADFYTNDFVPESV
jgi:hypothetical protein